MTRSVRGVNFGDAMFFSGIYNAYFYSSESDNNE